MFVFTSNFLFCIGVYLIDNVMVVSGEQQRDSALHIRVSIVMYQPGWERALGESGYTFMSFFLFLFIYLFFSFVILIEALLIIFKVFPHKHHILISISIWVGKKLHEELPSRRKQWCSLLQTTKFKFKVYQNGNKTKQTNKKAHTEKQKQKYVFLFKSFSFQRLYLVWSVPFALWDSSWIIQTADKHCYFLFCSVLENKVLPSDFILPDFVLPFALWFQRGLLSERKMEQGWGSARRLFFFF